MLLGAFGPFFTFSYQSSDSHPAPRTSDQSLTKSWISHLLAFRKDNHAFTSLHFLDQDLTTSAISWLIQPIYCL